MNGITRKESPSEGVEYGMKMFLYFCFCEELLRLKFDFTPTGFLIYQMKLKVNRRVIILWKDRRLVQKVVIQLLTLIRRRVLRRVQYRVQLATL